MRLRDVVNGDREGSEERTNEDYWEMGGKLA